MDAAEQAALISAGTMVDHFKVVRLAGRGGMGEVYLARDTKLGRKVALKLVHPEALGDERAVERFLHEARTTAKFSHPHIVQVHYVGEHAGRPYVALEYLEGATLRDRMEERRLSAKETIRIGLAVAEALAEAHEHGVLHRDLKPENVIIPPDGRLRVVDFGLAKTITEEQAVASADTQDVGALDTDLALGETFKSKGGLMGTPLYMAPEQWEGEEVTGAIDVWALGVMLYELLGGTHPYEQYAFARKLFALAGKVCGDAPVPPLVAEGVPAKLHELTSQALAKDADERPSAADVVDALAGLLHRDRARLDEEQSPFRGLLPFTEEHAELFFGRDAEIAQFLERLRHEPTLPVVGPSGAGKSSFVQAGVIPRLLEQDRWLVLKMRPGRQPFEVLASRLVRGQSSGPASRTGPRSRQGAGPSSRALDKREEDISVSLAESPARLGLELGLLAEQQQAPVLLFVDQLEELYTLVEDEAVRRAFMEALCEAADDPEGPIRVVFTLRDDFLGRLAASRVARDALSRVTLLQTPAADDLADVVLEPVQMAGYAYDDPLLVDEMVAAVRDEPAALPLLQFGAQKLWERRDEDEKLLLRSAYEELGGVEGALAQQADRVVEGLDPKQLGMARELLLRLVTPDRTRRTMPREELLDGLDDHGREVLGRLLEARLVQLRKSRAGRDKAESAKEERDGSMVELVHESLILRWNRLSRWLDESREDVAFFDEVSKAAELWERRGRHDEELWRGDPLHEALRRAEQQRTLPEMAVRFLDASEELDQKWRLRKRWGVGVGFALLTLVAVVLLLLNREANQGRRDAEVQRQQAEHERAQGLVEGARVAVGVENMLEARAKLRRALELGDSPLARSLWSVAVRNPLVWSLDLGTSTWHSAMFPGGETLAVGGTDGSVYLIDTRSAEVRSLRGHSAGVHAVAVGPKGEWLASGSADGELRVQNLNTGETKIDEGGPRVTSVLFGPEGRVVYWSSSQGAVIERWDVGTGTKTRFSPCVSSCRGLAVSPDGRWLATGSGPQVVVLDAQTGTDITTLRGPGSRVNALSFSPDMRWLAAATLEDAAVRLWGTESWAVERVLRGRRVFYPGALTFFTDSSRLAVGTFEGDVHIWDLASNEALQLRAPGPLQMVGGVAYSPAENGVAAALGHVRRVAFWRLSKGQGREDVHDSPRTAQIGVAFGPSGDLLAVGDEGGSVSIVDAASGALVRRLRSDDGMALSVAFSSDGELLATAHRDGSVRVSRVEDGSEVHLLAAHRVPALGLAFHPDGRLLVTVGGDGRACLWDAVGGDLVQSIETDSSWHYSAAFCPDGGMLATAGESGVLRLFDTRSWTLARSWQFGEQLRGVAFLAGAKRLVTSSLSGTIRTIDVETGESTVVERGRMSGWPLAAHPYGSRIGLGGIDGRARIVDIDANRTIDLVGHSSGEDVNVLRMSPDGRLAATTGDDGTVRLWEVDSGKPVWRAPLILSTEPAILSHRGWQRLDRPEDKPSPIRTDWGRAVSERARQASQSADGAHVCVHTHDSRLELWSIRQDARVLDEPVDCLSRVVALAEGCMVLGKAGASVYLASGERAVLSLDAVAVDRSDDGLLVATGEKVVSLEVPAPGRPSEPKARRTWQVGAGTSSMALVGSWLLAGRTNGELDRLARDEGGTESPVKLERASASSVATIVEGPARTVLVGHQDGTVGLISLETGHRLRRWYLHGSAIHLRVRGDTVYAASELGDTLVADLSVYTRKRCDLLREIWSEVPVTWKDGRAVVEPPPGEHECAAR